MSLHVALSKSETQAVVVHRQEPYTLQGRELHQVRLLGTYNFIPILKGNENKAAFHTGYRQFGPQLMNPGINNNNPAMFLIAKWFLIKEYIFCCHNLGCWG